MLFIYSYAQFHNSLNFLNMVEKCQMIFLIFPALYSLLMANVILFQLTEITGPWFLGSKDMSWISLIAFLRKCLCTKDTIHENMSHKSPKAISLRSLKKVGLYSIKLSVIADGGQMLDT